jgi:hypothetical protein
MADHFIPATGEPEYTATNTHIAVGSSTINYSGSNTKQAWSVTLLDPGVSGYPSTGYYKIKSAKVWYTFELANNSSSQNGRFTFDSEVTSASGTSGTPGQVDSTSYTFGRTGFDYRYYSNPDSIVEFMGSSANKHDHIVYRDRSIRLTSGFGGDTIYLLVVGHRDTTNGLQNSTDIYVNWEVEFEQIK